MNATVVEHTECARQIDHYPTQGLQPMESQKDGSIQLSHTVQSVARENLGIKTGETTRMKMCQASST